MGDLTMEQKREFNALMAKVRRGQTHGIRSAMAKERSQSRKARALELYEAGMEINDIAEDLGLNRATIAGYLKNREG